MQRVLRIYNVKNSKEKTMKPTPPTKSVFWLSVIFAVLGMIPQFGVLDFLTAYSFWLVVIAYVLLFLGVVLKGF